MSPVTYVEPEPTKPEKPFEENTGRGKSGFFGIAFCVFAFVFCVLVIMYGSVILYEATKWGG